MARKKIRRVKPRGKRSLKFPTSVGKNFPDYEQFLERMEEMIVLIDRKYRVVMANGAYLRYRETDKEKIVGCRVPDISGKEVFENDLKPRMDECFKGKVVKFEMKYRFPNLGEREVFVSYFPVNGPKRVERVACVFQDITEHKRADAAMLQERDRAQLYLDIADVILLALDLDGRITLINRKGCTTLGWKESELIGRDWVDTCMPVRMRETLRATFDRLLAGDMLYVEKPVLTKSGEERMIGWRNTLLNDMDGRVIGTLSSGEDVTERKLAESALRRMSGLLLRAQDDERRRLARELHDGIGTYVSGLSLALGKIREFLQETDPAHQSVISECKSLIHAAGGEIRAMSYLLHPPTLEELGLESALEWLVRGFSERSGINISLVLPKGLGRFTPEIELTIFRVTQEALNNAYRHSGSNSASVRLLREAAAIVLEIADQGKGAGPGFEASGPNLTVGVSGMRERVRDIGGTLTIESLPDKGWVVRATLPVSSAGEKTLTARNRL